MGLGSILTQRIFNLKVKFCHLVKKAKSNFIMEEPNKPNLHAREWISGGKGDIKRLQKNFNIGFLQRNQIF
jgi:erythromycin esterase